jgi:hypothetical protein
MAALLLEHTFLRLHQPGYVPSQMILFHGRFVAQGYASVIGVQGETSVKSRVVGVPFKTFRTNGRTFVLIDMSAKFNSS